MKDELGMINIEELDSIAESLTVDKEEKDVAKSEDAKRKARGGDISYKQNISPDSSLVLNILLNSA